VVDDLQETFWGPEEERRDRLPVPPKYAGCLPFSVAVSSHESDSTIERILELSAEAQIKRREPLRILPAFHNLTGSDSTLANTWPLSKLKEVQTNRYSNNCYV